MVDKIGGWREGTVNIDIDGGKYDTLTQALADKGVTSYIYEPYGRTSNENAYILAQLQSKELQGDTATCSNVLNVIKESEVRDNVVHQVSKAIKPDGVAYFTIYEGNGKGRGAKDVFCLFFMAAGVRMEKCSVKCKKTKFCLHNRAKCG